MKYRLGDNRSSDQPRGYVPGARERNKREYPRTGKMETRHHDDQAMEEQTPPGKQWASKKNTVMYPKNSTNKHDGVEHVLNSRPGRRTIQAHGQGSLPKEKGFHASRDGHKPY